MSAKSRYLKEIHGFMETCIKSQVYRSLSGERHADCLFPVIRLHGLTRLFNG